jgi:hypothetical protein
MKLDFSEQHELLQNVANFQCLTKHCVENADYASLQHDYCLQSNCPDAIVATNVTGEHQKQGRRGTNVLRGVNKHEYARTS